MRLRPTLAPLLVLALLLGQWLAVAHGSLHAKATEPAHACQLCVHAPALDDLVAGGEPASLALRTMAAASAQAAPLPPARRTPTAHRSRGPPTLFA